CALTHYPPSMLLIREEGEPDPIDEFITTLVRDETANAPRVQDSGPFMNAPIERAPQSMKNAVILRRKLGERIATHDYDRQFEADAAEKKFRAAQRTGHGHGRTRSYGKAWHPEYGLLTDEDGELIL